MKRTLALILDGAQRTGAACALMLHRAQRTGAACALLGIGCLLSASLLPASDVIPQRIQVTRTEHADLPAGGALRFKNSTGELTIEGWDQPGVEITTTKSTKLEYSATGAEHDKASHMLDEIKVTAAPQGNDLVITTDFPRHRRFLPRPSVGSRDFDLDYLIRVPRDAKIFVDHDAGEIHFDGVTGDINATVIQGLIMLRVPQSAQYSIDAKSKIGGVNSDFPGTTTRKRFGHSFMQENTQTNQAPHSLYLRNGFGDIIILKIRQAPPLP
jgi:hypothetical protein